MKVAASLPEDVFLAAEAMVEARGCSRSALYAEALRFYLKAQDPQAITARLDQVHGTDAGDAREMRRKANRAAFEASDW